MSPMTTMWYWVSTNLSGEIWTVWVRTQPLTAPRRLSLRGVTGARSGFRVCKGICTALLDAETFCGSLPKASSVTLDTSKEPELGAPNLYPLPLPQGILPARAARPMNTDTPTDTSADVLLSGGLSVY